MGQFYIDDSVHDDAGFIIAACVYTNIDINEKIISVIKSFGFDPEIFEYKSSANYSKEPEKVNVREELKELLIRNCKVGIVILPRNKREELGFECIKAVKQFIDNNKSIKSPINIYLDQGLFRSKAKTENFIAEQKFKDCIFHLEQSSKDIRGIQLADLAAHISSIQLKDALGFIKKKVKAGENSGYEPDLEIELGFEMFATLRYAFFCEDIDGPVENELYKVEPFGLYISELCDQLLIDIARKKFGDIYLGCIH